MEMMTSGWTDERMDDLKQEVEKQGRRMEDGFRDLRSEMRSEIGGLRTEMDARFDRLGERLETRFDTMLYALIAFGGAMFAGMASLVAALIVTQL
ncbi:MAG TPA: hypothetical protein VHR65_07090 [Solirubrobacterales bacterium]|jgi:hypothetical protein|nr:hypothetical protein [Solirubrobacterales bacterium]